MNTVQKELGGGDKIPVSSADDLALKLKVEAFLKAKSEPTTPTETPAPAVEIKPDLDFDQPGAIAELATEGMIDFSNAQFTDFEKELFLKSILTEEPVRMPISLFNGKLNIDMRGRYAYEQRRVLEILKEDQKDKIIAEDDVAHFITRMQYYSAGLMVEKINGVPFSSLVLSPTTDRAVELANMREMATKVEGLTGTKWTAILNALRLFESKCARLSSLAANPDF